MTREEWQYRYRVAWSLHRPDLGPAYFTPTALDVAYDDLVVDYPDDPEGAVQFMIDDTFWTGPDGLAVLWGGLTVRQ